MAQDMDMYYQHIHCLNFYGFGKECWRMPLYCDKAILFRLLVVRNTSANNFSTYNHSFQENYTTFPEANQGKALYIINSIGIGYHQHEVLYIIKPQGKCTLARDEIQPEGLMRYTLTRDDMPSLWLG